MNGDTTGLVSTDASSEGDSLQRWRRAVTAFNECAAAACEVGEWKLQREAEDAAARAVSFVHAEERQQTLQLGGVDGEDPQDARQKAQQVSGARSGTA